MSHADLNAQWPERVRFGALAVLIIACFAGGGASRVDVLSLVYLHPLAVICLAAIILTPGPIDWRMVRVPLSLLLALSGIILVQLIPLPPALWAALPGHAPFAEFARQVGAEEAWRPISLTPDLTLASFVSLIVPITALIGFASIPHARTYGLIKILLIGGAFSILVGLLQIAGGDRSPFYTYAITSQGLAVGLFSNRNHQALLLIMMWPILAIWASQTTDNRRADNARLAVAVAIAVLLLPMLLITGSRAGIALAPVGLLFGWLIWRRENRLSFRLSPTMKKLALAGAAATGLAVIFAAIVQSRDEAIRRFLDISFEDESRLQYIPSLLKMVGDYFPVGAGFGSFDPIYRFYEPDRLLSGTYLNHAHNDLLEIGIEGGLPAILIVVVFMIWILRAGISALREQTSSRRLSFGLLAISAIFLLLASSLVDYPLRTPLLSAIFAIACGWVAQMRDDVRDAKRRL